MSYFLVPRFFILNYRQMKQNLKILLQKILFIFLKSTHKNIYKQSFEIGFLKYVNIFKNKNIQPVFTNAARM